MARVFISHRGSDTAEAEKLARALKALGHVVRFDDWEVVTGDSILGWMEEATGSAGFLVLCYSAVGVDAPWVSREWLSALSRQLEGEPIRTLPVRLSGKTGPAILADIKAADWMADPARAVADLQGAIIKVEARRGGSTL